MDDWHPCGTPEAMRLRAKLNALIRSFFAEGDALEVETPVLSRSGNTDPHIASFSLQFSGRTDGAPRTRWLRTSPEFPLKRLLAAGIGDCYELGRVFLARGLRAVADDRQGIEEQAMTVERHSLADAVRLVTSGEVHDAKTVIGLLVARERLGA